jgi:hypothetical protein
MSAFGPGNPTSSRNLANRRAKRADDRRVTGNTEGRRASFDSGFFAQSEAKLTNADDVGQGKGRAREAAWGGNRGAGGWTPY